jgi:hypothetical protein
MKHFYIGDLEIGMYKQSLDKAVAGSDILSEAEDHPFSSHTYDSGINLGIPLILSKMIKSKWQFTTQNQDLTISDRIIMINDSHELQVAVIRYL